VHAFVVARENRTIDADSVRSFCAERLSDYKVPETVTVLTHPLPRNSNGKIQKEVLRAQL
jgi:acyl-CoA synthetase (AMP-forming)/AMP-acid ligase II